MTAASATATRVCSLAAPIVRRVPICHDHVQIDVEVTAFPASHPGQFLQVLCRDLPASDADVNEPPASSDPASCAAPGFSQAFLRRPFSIANHTVAADGRARLSIISRAIGPGTVWLSRSRVGERLDITGPLGRGFRITPGEHPLVLVGGGVGIPPLIYLARALHEAGRTNVTVVFGATAGDLLPVRCAGTPSSNGTPTRCVELAGATRYPAIVTTDDGSLGLRGRVTDGLAAWCDRVGSSAAGAVVYACGPEPMLRAVAGLTRARGLDCQLCIERMMGCGLGTCLSCVVRVRDADRPGGWRWALSCSEGPVFARDELVDYATGRESVRPNFAEG
jgi:dihydroorotate dehydrogenase electron transfer subunit